MSIVYPLNASVALIETSQLICTANQLTGFYMRSTLAHNDLSISPWIQSNLNLKI